MRALLSSLRFILGTLSGRDPGWPIEQTTLTLSDGLTLATDVYRPRGRPLGDILFLHGMTPRGRRDPRQVRAAGVLARDGYRVICPEIPDLSEMRVTSRSLEHVAGAIGAAFAREDLAAGRPLGLFSVSYSAALCLIAAARPELQDKVSGVLSIGTYADGVRWTSYLMMAPDSDLYGRLICFRNFLPFVLGERPALWATLEAHMRDELLQDGRDRVAATLPALSEEEAALHRGLCDDLAVRRAWGERLVAEAAPQTFRGLMPQEVAPRLRVPVALLHGSTDAVIPPEESRALHAVLQANGTPSLLLVTPLLTHGDTRVTLEAARQGLDVVRGFAWYFRAVLRAAA